MGAGLTGAGRADLGPSVVDDRETADMVWAAGVLADAAARADHASAPLFDTLVETIPAHRHAGTLVEAVEEIDVTLRNDVISNPQLAARQVADALHFGILCLVSPQGNSMAVVAILAHQLGVRDRLDVTLVAEGAKVADAVEATKHLI